MHAAESDRSSAAGGRIFNSSTDFIASNRSVTQAQMAVTSILAAAAFFAEAWHCSIERTR